MEPTPASVPDPADPSNKPAGEEEECGWCKWMKAGGCQEQFEVWLKCVDAVRDAGREDVETCASVMSPLWECMSAHAEYYGPQVDALKDRKSEEETSGATPGSEGSSPPSETAAVHSTDKGGSAPLDVDNMTEADLERLLDQLDQEDSKTSQ